MPFQFAKSSLSRTKKCPDWPGGDPGRHIPRSEGVRATQLQPTELSPSRHHQPSNDPHTGRRSGCPILALFLAHRLSCHPSCRLSSSKYSQPIYSISDSTRLLHRQWIKLFSGYNCHFHWRHASIVDALLRRDTHAPAAASDPNLAELFQAWPYSTQSLRFPFQSAPANQDQPHHINLLAKNLYNQLTCILWISHMFLVTSLRIDILWAGNLTQ